MSEEEQVLVIPSNLVELEQGLTLIEDCGINFVHDEFLRDEATFQPRSKMEQDESYRQIIPYVVFVCGNAVYAYQRMRGQGESRLHGKCSIGIGGHINPVDGTGVINQTYLNALYRELNEEVEILSSIKRHSLVGFINDTQTPVGRVHLGVLCVIELEHPLLTPIDEAMKDLGFKIPEHFNYLDYEEWSRIILESNYLFGLYGKPNAPKGREQSIDGLKVKLPIESDTPFQNRDGNWTPNTEGMMSNIYYVDMVNDIGQQIANEETETTQQETT